MGLHPCSLILMLVVIGTTNAGDFQYVKASGKWLWREAKWTDQPRKNICSTSKFNSNNDTGVLYYQNGLYEVRIADDGTYARNPNDEMDGIDCKKDSDITYREYKEKEKQQPMNWLGTFEFTKPFTGVLNATHTVMAIKKAASESAAIMWHSMETGWAGVDQFFGEYEAISRMWWDSFDTETPPTSTDTDFSNQCDSDPGDMPTADCSAYENAAEASYSFSSKPLVGSGKYIKKTDNGWINMNAKVYNDPERKLLAVVYGDPKQQDNPAKFNFGMWLNATTGYVMLAGERACHLPNDWSYDAVAYTYGTPFLVWAGEATLRKFWPDTAEGVTVNMYQGMTDVFGKKHGLINLADTEGLYRGQMFFDEYNWHPSSMFLDTVDERTPDLGDFEVPPHCKGHKHFDGHFTGAATPLSAIGWIPMMLFLCCSFFLKTN